MPITVLDIKKIAFQKIKIFNLSAHKDQTKLPEVSISGKNV